MQIKMQTIVLTLWDQKYISHTSLLSTMVFYNKELSINSNSPDKYVINNLGSTYKTYIFHKDITSKLFPNNSDSKL